MRKILLLGALVLGTAIAAPQGKAASIGHWQTTVHPTNDVELVRRDGRRGDWRGGGPRHSGVRAWHRKPHYGNVIAGIALGTIIAAAAANAAPPPPSPDLCWYWTDRRHSHGYWDYCG